MAKSLGKVWENIMRHKFLRMGLPFVIFVAGGSFFLKQFTTIRYDFRQGRKLSQEEANALGLKLIDVEKVQHEVMKEIEQADVDSWENIRGPRPWEDSKTVQQVQREKLPKADANR